MARPSPPSNPPGAERKLVTVLLIDVDEAREGFADVDPEDAGRTLARQLARVRAEVEAHGGVVEETLGGRTVAVFGIPRTRDDDPERAVRAALAVRDALGREASRELRVQAAVVTGQALVRPGAGGRGRQRVTGDPLAAAARLQETVPAGTVMVSETARMKHAEHWQSSSTPTLNQTGELKAAFWLTSRWVSSAWNASPSASVAK